MVKEGQSCDSNVAHVESNITVNVFLFVSWPFQKETRRLSTYKLATQWNVVILTSF